MTDKEASANFAANVLRLLAANGKSIYWLMLETGYNENRIYPALKGEFKPSVGMLATVAAKLGVSCDDLLAPEMIREKKKKKSSKIPQPLA